MKGTTRRGMLGQALAGGLALGRAAGAAERAPNILFAIADDWMWPHASMAGEPVVKTPTFDRVARSGVLFTNAFVSAPSCSPSRAAILTGQYHWRLEEGANLGGTLATKYRVYPEMLAGAGYHVGYTRKGWAPGDPKPGGRTGNPAGAQYKDFETFLAARREGAPFCFWFGGLDPHRPYEWGSGEAAGLDPRAVRVPPYLPDHETVRKDICDYFAEVQRFDRDVAGLLAAIEKRGELENTLVVMTGDNGWPFPRSKATVYSTGTHVPLAISWPARVAGGRTIEDFVGIPDVAPTFLEAAGVKAPAEMTARSLMGLLTSQARGRVDPKRSHILTGMERHVPCRGAERGGYPSRALRTHEYHYIRNFKPERWAAGDPNGVEKAGAQPFGYDELASSTFVAFGDVDAGPTKAHMVLHREEAGVRPLYEGAFGKRPARELYDLKNDPYQMHNVAGEARYAGVVKKLDGQLMGELKASGDPRGVGGGEEFERYIWYQGLARGR